MEVKRILIVDDHFDTLKFLRSLLELADNRYQVVAVRSGEEAGLELRRPFDLLITDIHLPGIDGIEVATRPKAHARDAHHFNFGLSQGVGAGRGAGF